MSIRLACKKAFVEADCSQRLASAAQRKAAPTPGDHKVGDLLRVHRENKGQTVVNERWSTAKRIISFDGSTVFRGLNETVPKDIA